MTLFRLILLALAFLPLLLLPRPFNLLALPGIFVLGWLPWWYVVHLVSAIQLQDAPLAKRG